MPYRDLERKRQYGREYAAMKRKQMYLGTWENRLVPADKAREHVMTLHRMGLSYCEIAHLAGESPGQMSVLVYPNHGTYVQNITTAREKRLLAVEFDIDRMLDGSKIPIDGTRRRIQALQVMGWPASELGKRLGITHTTVSLYQSRKREKVTVRVAKKIRDIYEELCMIPGPSQRASTMAIKSGFVGPLCWDDDSIDDPNARPVGATARRKSTWHEPKSDTHSDIYTCWRCGIRALRHSKRHTGLCKSCYDIMGGKI